MTDTTATPTTTIATTIAPEFDFKPFETADILVIAQKMSEPGLSDEIKYKLARLMLEKTKQTFIDPMKDIRDKEKAEEQKKAEDRAKTIAQYRTRIETLLSDDVLDDFGVIAKDYIEAGHGNIVQIDIFAKRDPATNEVKVEYTSNLSKPRARVAASTKQRESGSTGAGVLVYGAPKEGVTTLTGSVPATVLEPKQFSFFSEAARELGFVDDTTEMKGLNSKRLLESKGYTCKYVEKPAEAAPAPVADANTGVVEATPAS